jgi:hypothetical protein
MLVLADGIRHDGDIINGNTDAGGRELAVGVAADRLMESHQGGVTDEKFSPLIVSPRINETA